MSETRKTLVEGLVEVTSSDSRFPAWLERWLPKSKTARWLVVIVGALLINALGNPVWTYGLSPLLSAVRDVLLDFATFGRESTRATIYREIARARPDLLAQLIITPVLMLVGITYTTLAGSQFEQVHEAARETDKIEESLDEMDAKLDALSWEPRQEKPPTTTQEEFEEARRDAKALITQGRDGVVRQRRMVSRIRRWALTQVIIGVVIAIYLFLDLVRISYVREAVTRYEQLRRIDGPYLSTAEDALIVSQFARIEKRDDYLRVVRRLEEVARSNGIKVEPINPW